MFLTSKKKLSTVYGILCLVLLFGLSLVNILNPKAVAAPNEYLNFQARLLNAAGAVVPDGNYNVEFKLYTVDTGGSDIWTETRTGGDRVRVVNGYTTVNLGSVNPLSPSFDWSSRHWLTMNIGGTGGSPSWDGEMDPRLLLTAVPYAFKAANVASGSTSTASTNSNNVSVTTGNATGSTSNSGNITIDVGTATGTTGTLSLGASNASALLLGRSGVVAAVQGGISVAEGTSLNGNTTIGNASSDLLTINSVIQGTDAFVFEGATSDGFETTFQIQDPTADVTYRFLATAAGTYDICTTTGNCSGVGGGVTTPGGTANRLTMFTAASTIADAWLYQNSSTLELDNTRNLSLLGGDLTVTGAGTFSGLITANGNLTIQTGDTLTFNGDVFDDLTGTGLTISSGDLQTTLGTSVDLTTEVTGVLPIANGGTNANTAPGARTNLGAAASGANADITSTTALNTITPSGALTIGDTGEDFILQGTDVSTITASAGGFTTTVGFTTPAADTTILFPAGLSPGTYDICTTQGNCSGVGGGVTTPGGTTNRLTIFTGVSSIDDSWLLQNSSTLELDNGKNFSLLGGDLSVTGAGTFSGLLTANGNLTVQTGDTLTVNGDGFTDLTGTGLTISSGTLQTTLGTSVDLTSEVTGTLPVGNGGTGATSFTAGSILFGNGTSAFTESGVLTNGQLLIGDNSGAPTAATLTQGSDIVVTNGAGSITIAVSESPTFTTSVTTPLVTSTAGLNITGGTTLTLASTGAGNDIIINGADILDIQDNTTFAGAIDVAGNADVDSNLQVGGTSIFTGLITANGGLTVETGDTFTFNGDAFTDLTGTGLTISSGSLQTTLGISVDLTSEVTGILPIANGGTNASTSQGAINNLSQLTTNGDLLYNNGTNSTRLARGSNGQCLTSDATTVVWGSCAGAGTVLFTLQGTSGTPQTINGGDTVTIAAGTNIVTSAGSTDTVTVSVVNNPTFSGLVTANGKLYVNTATSADANAQVLIGAGGDANKPLVVQANSGSQSANLFEAQTSSGSVAFRVSANGQVLGSADSAVSSGSTTLRTGNTTGGTGLTTGDLTLRSGNGTGTDTNSGSVILDAGNVSGTGTAGVVSLGATNASAITLGHTGITTTNAGAFTVTQLLTANGGLTVETGDTFTFNGDGFTDLTGSGLAISSGALIVDDSSATGFFRNDGNSFGGTATLGTNDTEDLVLETDDTPRLTITSTGEATFSDDVTVSGATTLNGGLTVETGDTFTFNGDAFTDLTGTGLTISSGSLQTTLGISVDLTSEVTGILPIANGGTNASTSQGAINNLSQLTTNGDLLYNNGTNSTRLARGANGECLTSNATTIVWGNCLTSGTLVFTLQGTSGTPQPINGGDTVTIAAGTNVTTTAGATDTITVAVVNNPTFSGLVTAQLGANISGATTNVNASSNFDTNVNTGTSTGAVNIGNSAAGAIGIESASTVGVTGTTTVTGLGSGSGTALTANNSTSTGNIFEAQDNGTAVLTVANGGATTFTQLITANGGLTVETGDTFTFNGDAFTDLTGTGLTISSGSLQTTLGISVDLTSEVTGILPIANGGTNASTSQGAINNLSQLTTNGDLLYNNGTNSTRLARGANGECLTSNATTIVWGNCLTSGTLVFTLQGTSGTPQPINGGDTVTIAAGTNVTTTAGATDTITVAVVNNPTFSGLVTAQLGANISGATTNVNASSNFDTNVNTGTSTGAVNIGNSAAGAIGIESASTVGVTGTTTVTGLGSGSGTALTANNSTSTGNIFEAQDNGTAVLTVANGGATTFTQLITANGGLTVETGDTFTFNGDAFTDLTGTGLTISSGSLQTTLGISVDLTSEVTGILPIANGGTNASTSQGAINNLSQLTTNGDLLYNNGTNSTRLARGANGECLTSNATTIVWGNCLTSGTLVFTLQGTSGTPQPINGGDTVTIAAGTNVTTTAGATDTITVAVVNNPTFSGLVTAQLGANISGATTNVNASSNFDTNVNTGTSTGAVNIGNSAAGAIGIESASTVGVTGTTTVTGLGSGSGTALTANNSTSTGNIFEAQDNGTAVLTVANGGATTFTQLITANGGLTVETGDTFTFNGDAFTDLTGTGLTISSGSLQTTLGISVDLTSEVTGILPIANGGTNASTSQGAINNLSQLTTNGDLLYNNGTNSTRLARGANGECLTSNATTIVWGNCLTSGTLVFTLQGTSGTPQPINGGDTVTIAAGTNVTTTAGATDTITVAVVNNPTFTTSVTTPLLTSTAGLNITGGTTLTLASTGAGNDVVIDGADILDVQDNTTFAGTVVTTGLTTLNGGLTVETGDTFTFNGDAFTDLTGTGLTISSGALQTTLGTSVDLTSEVNGILPVLNGGTGSNTLNDLITLGAYTTGNYVSSNTAGTGIAITGTPGEGWSPTVSLDYAATLASNTLATNQSSFASTGLLFEGTTANGFETLLTSTDPTADNTVSLPDESGTICLQTSANCGFALAGSGVTSLNSLTGALSIQGNSQIGVSASSPNISLSIQNDSIGDTQLAFNTGQHLTTASSPSFNGLTLTTSVTTPLVTSTAGLNITGGTTLTLASTGAGNDIIINGADILDIQDNTTFAGAIDVAGNADVDSNLQVGGTSIFTGLITANGGLTVETGDTFTFNGDAFTDLTGTGLTISSGSLQTTLGISVDLTSEVTGILPIANGGTNASTSQGAINNLSQLTTNGDLLYNNGTNSTRLARGSNGQCLTSDATTVVWGSCAGAGTVLFTLQGTSGTPQTINGGDTVTIAAGTNIVTSAGSTDTVTVSVVNNPTFSGLVTAQLGANISGATTNVNASSNFATNINTGTSTGAVNVGNSAAGAIAVQSASTIGITGTTTITGLGGGSTKALVVNNSTSTGNIFEAQDNGTAVLTVADGGAITATQLVTLNGGLTVETGDTFTVNGDGFTDLTGTGLTISSGTLQTTLGTSVDLTSEVTGTLPVGNGGTGATSFTAGSILFGNGTSAFTESGVLTNGQLLIGDNSGAPTAATLTQGSDIVVTNGAGSITIAVSESPTFTTSVTTPLVTSTAGLNITGGTTLTLASTGAGNDIIINGADILDIQDNTTFAGTVVTTGLTTLNGGLTIETGDTLTFNGDGFTDLTGTGLTISSGALQTTLGTSVDLTTEVNGLLPIANGGTNASTSQGAINNISQLTTEGDLLYHNGTNSTRLPRGSNGECLTSNATTLVWGNCLTSSTLVFTLQGTSGTPQSINGGDTVTIAAGTNVITTAGATDTVTVSIVNNPTFSGLVTANGDLTVQTGDTLTVNGDGFTDLTGTGLTISSGTLQTTLGTSVDLTSEVTGTLPVGNGGTGATSFTAGSILFGNGTSAFTESGVLTNGQLLIGDNSGAPTAATLTQGSDIVVTNGAGSITIAVSESPTFTTSVTTPLVTSTAGLNITGGTTLTLASTGAGNDIIINGADILDIQDNTTFAGTVDVTGASTFTALATFNGNLTVQTGDTLTVNGDGFTDLTGTGLTISSGTLQTTLGTSVDLTSEVTGTLPVGNGGTGATSFTAGSILFGNGTSAFTESGVLTNGQLLIGDNSGAPTAATLTQGSDIVVTNGAGSITIAVSESPTFTTSVTTPLVTSTAGLNITGGTTLTLASTGAGNDIIINGADILDIQDNTTFAGTVDVTGASTFTALATFNGNLTVQTGDTVTINGDAFTDLTGTGLTISGGSLQTTLGTSVDLTSEVSGTLPIGNGGTNSTTSQGAIDNISQLTTNGDLLYHNGTNSTRLARGSSGQCLTSNGTTISYSTCATSTSTFFTLQGTSGSSQAINGGDTVTIAAGTNVTTTGGATDTVTVAIVNNPTFTTSVTTPLVTSTAGLNITGGTTLTLASTGAGNDIIINGADILDIQDNTTFAGTVDVTGASTFTALATFNGNLTVQTGDTVTINGDAFTDLTGTGLTISGGSLQTTLGTSVDLTSEVSGTLPIGNGGTNSTTSQGAINNLSQLTTNGDLLYNNGTNSTRLARGANGECLTSNATTILWGACAVGLTGLTLAGTSGTPQTISDNDTITIAAGSNLSTTAGATDTVTVALVANPTLTGLLTLNGGLTVETGDTFTFNGDAFTDLTGTGLTISGGSLQTTLGTSVDLTSEVSGTLPIGNGGTNSTTSQGAIDNISQLTTNGDLLYHNGTNSTRLARGSSGQCLTSNGTTISYSTCATSTSTFFTLQGTSGSSQAINGGDTVTIAAGTNVTTTGGATDTVTVAIVNNPTFSGLVTANGSLTVETGDTLTVNGDGFTDLTGTGLAISGGALGLSYSNTQSSNSLAANESTFSSNGIIFEGSTADANEWFLGSASGNPTADRILELPNLSGTLAVTDAAQTFSNTQTFSGTLDSYGTTNIGDATTDRLTVTSQILGASPFVFQGTTDDSFETSLAVTDPTADRTITFPNATGTVALLEVSQTFTNTQTFSGTLSATGTTEIGDAATDIVTVAATIQGASPLNFEGASADNFETTLAFTDPTADRTITFPNANGTVAVSASGNISLNSSGDISFTGTLPLANGGTNATTAQGAINNISGLTNEGDLLYNNGTNSFRLSRGSNGQCLTANTTTILWGSCASTTTTFFTLAGSAGTPQSINGGDTVTIIAGSNISTTASATDSLTVAVTNNPTFSGLVTAQAGLTVTAGQALTVNGDAIIDFTGNGLLESGNSLVVDDTSSTGFFKNGGNSFSGAGTIGTNNAQSLLLETNNVTKLTVESGGNILVGTSDTTGALFVLDEKTGSGDPTGVIGGMYYNSNTAKFRCYEGSAWSDCLGLQRVPGATAVNTITPTANSVVGLTVNGTSGTAAIALSVVQSGAATGISNTSSSTGTAEAITLSNTSGTQTAGLSIDRSGSGGTTTSLLSLIQSGGTATNGILFTGTIGTDVTTDTNRSLTINSNGTGTMNFGSDTGAKSINIGTGGTGAKTVVVGSTASTGTTTIQSGSGGVLLQPSGANVLIGTSDTTGTLIVLDTKTDSGDPTGVNGGMYYNSSIGKFRCYQNGLWRNCIGGLVNVNTSPDTIASTAAETNFATNYVIAANTCTAGKVFRITGQGIWGTTGGSHTLNIRFKIGSVVLSATGDIAIGANINNAPFRFEYQITCITNTSTGTVEASGEVRLYTNQTTFFAQQMLTNAGTVGPIDFTTNQTLQVSADYDTSHANNTITLRQIIYEDL